MNLVDKLPPSPSGRARCVGNKNLQATQCYTAKFGEETFQAWLQERGQDQIALPECDASQSIDWSAWERACYRQRIEYAVDFVRDCDFGLLAEELGFPLEKPLMP